MPIRNPICLSITVPIIVATIQISPNLIQLSNPAIVPNSILFTSQSKGGAVDYKFTASEKNYTIKTNENEISTHEETFRFQLVPSLRSDCKTQIYKKTPLFFFEEVGVFPNSVFSSSLCSRGKLNFCKSLIMWLRPNFIFYSQALRNEQDGK